MFLTEYINQTRLKLTVMSIIVLTIISCSCVLFWGRILGYELKTGTFGTDDMTGWWWLRTSFRVGCFCKGFVLQQKPSAKYYRHVLDLSLYLFAPITKIPIVWPIKTLESKTSWSQFGVSVSSPQNVPVAKNVWHSQDSLTTVRACNQ